MTVIAEQYNAQYILSSQQEQQHYTSYYNKSANNNNRNNNKVNDGNSRQITRSILSSKKNTNTS